MNRAIRVMVVGGSPVLCAGLVSLLDGYEDVELVAVGRSADKCRGVEADAAVVGLVGLDPDAATRTVGDVRARSEAKLVAVVDRVEDALGWAAAERVDACLNFGTVDSHGLVNAVRAVMRGQAIFSTEFLSELRTRKRAEAPGWTLTPRERDVLALLAEGQSNKSIAGELELQVGTVRIYVSTILAKLGVTNRTEATVMTLQQGVLIQGTRPAAADIEIATARHRKVGVPAG
jgi:NarL family two-component system response regulator LiaR